ncbi:MAG: glycosyltransferase, partial [Candidatus Paceibacterota bacterium]
MHLKKHRNSDTLSLKLGKSVHLSSVHHPFDTRIFYKECISLKKAGFDISLIAPHSHADEVQGIKIYPVKKYSSEYKRIIFTGWQVYKKAKELGDKHTVFHFHDPELIPFCLLLKLKGLKVIYDVHEDVPRQILSKPWIPRILKTTISYLVAKIESIAAMSFDKIIAAEPVTYKRFPPNKTELIRNYSIINELKLANLNSGENNIVYAGSITEIRGIRQLIKALELIPINYNVRLKLAGSFVPISLLDEMKKLPKWSKVDYIGWVDRNSLSELMTDCKIGMVVLNPVPKYLEAYPTKLFEYMSVGLPSIISDFPLWKEIMKEYQ